MKIMKDEFGVIELPDQALYGMQTARTIENMSFSGKILAQYPVYIQSLAKVKKAAAMANHLSGVIDFAVKDAIVNACDELIAGKYTDQFPVDVFHGGGSIGINMNVNEVLAALAGMSGESVHSVEHVNASQSTADACHTAIRIALIVKSTMLERSIQSILQVLDQKATEFAQIATIARTCWQDGMQVSAGVFFGAAASALSRRLESLRQAVTQIHRVNLGGTVIGSGVGASERYREVIVDLLREVTGLPLRLRSDLYDAAQYPDDLGRLSAEIRLISSILTKLAKDLRLLSSGPETGLAELSLPAVQAGSSFFPGKVNPVIPETVIQCGMLISGNDQTIQSAVEMGEIHLNLQDGMIGILLLDNLSMLTRTAEMFRQRCLTGVQINASVCERYANSFIPLIVKLKETYGYAQVASWMKELTQEEIKEKYGGSKGHE